MKRKLIILFLALLFLCTKNTTVWATEQSDADAEIQLDPNTITDKKEEYTALGDLYGISVFSDDFIEKEAQYKEAVNKYNEKILLAAINSDNQADNYQEVVNAVLTSADSKVIKDYSQNESKKKSLLFWLYCIFGGVCFLGMSILLSEKFMQKRSRKNEDNLDYYYIEDESVPSHSSAAKSQNQ